MTQFSSFFTENFDFSFMEGEFSFLLILVVSSLAFSALVGFVASSRGRSWENWFLISLFLSPLVGFVAVLAMGETREARLDRIQDEERLRAAIRRRELSREEE